MLFTCPPFFFSLYLSLFLIVHAPTLVPIAYPAYLVLAKKGCVTLRRRRAKQKKAKENR